MRAEDMRKITDKANAKYDELSRERIKKEFDRLLRLCVARAEGGGSCGSFNYENTLSTIEKDKLVQIFLDLKYHAVNKHKLIYIEW